MNNLTRPQQDALDWLMKRELTSDTNTMSVMRIVRGNPDTPITLTPMLIAKMLELYLNESTK